MGVPFGMYMLSGGAVISVGFISWSRIGRRAGRTM